jgi:hypothetical protein
MKSTLHLVTLVVALTVGILPLPGGPGPVFGHHCLGPHECNPDLDIDNDEAANEDDNCPFVVNANQTDADGDDLGDACESQNIFLLLPMTAQREVQCQTSL